MIWVNANPRPFRLPFPAGAVGHHGARGPLGPRGPLGAVFAEFVGALFFLITLAVTLRRFNGAVTRHRVPLPLPLAAATRLRTLSPSTPFPLFAIFWAFALAFIGAWHATWLRFLCTAAVHR